MRYHFQITTLSLLCFVGNLYGVRVASQGTVVSGVRKTSAVTESLPKRLVVGKKPAQLNLNHARDLHRLARLSYQKGDLIAAIRYNREERRLYSLLDPASVDYIKALNNAGVFAQQQGDLDLAEKYHRKALALVQRIQPHGALAANTLNDLGVIAERRGDLGQAEHYFLEESRLYSAIDPNDYKLSYAWGNLGTVAWYRGNLEAAKQYFQRALQRQQAAQQKEDAAISLNDLGMIALEQSDLPGANSYLHQAFDYQKGLGLSVELAQTMDSLATLERKRGHLKEAEQEYLQALSTINKVSPTNLLNGDITNNLGDLYRELKDLSYAEKYYGSAANTRHLLAPASGQYAQSLASLAQISRSQGRWDQAVDLYEKALLVLDEQVDQLGGGRQEERGFRANYSEYYADYVDLLVQQGNSRHALEVLERMHARTFLEMLQQGHVDVQKGIDTPTLAKRRKLFSSLGTASDQRVRLLAAGDKRKEVQSVEEQIDFLNQQIKELDYQIQKAHPRFAALTHPHFSSASELQSLLDDQTVLLEDSVAA